MRWSLFVLLTLTVFSLVPRPSSAQLIPTIPLAPTPVLVVINTTSTTSTVALPVAATTTPVVIPVVEPVATEPVVAAPTIPPLLAAIREARKVLKDTPHEHPVTAKSDTDFRDLRLAIWGPDTNQITYVDVKKKGDDLKCAGPCPVKVVTSNGVNSIFSVVGRPKAAVVALRYPLYLDQGTGKKKTFKIDEVVYTPYSTLFRTPEMVQAGKDYFDSLVHQSFVDLNQKGIRSKAFTDKLLTQVVDEQLAKAILTIEHADVAALQKDPDHALDRFYIILATNEDQAFGYARSSAGALGVAQFMPKTYAGMVKSRPELKLQPNFEIAMRSVSTSLKAQMLYLDTLLTELPIDARLGYFEYPEEAREFIVAAYNTGAGRVRETMSFWKQASGADSTQFSLEQRKQRLRELIKGREEVLANFIDPGRKKQQLKEIAQYKAQLTKLEALNYKKLPILKKETINYLKKYRELLPSFI